jgi:hypothetical protein
MTSAAMITLRIVFQKTARITAATIMRTSMFRSP